MIDEENEILESSHMIGVSDIEYDIISSDRLDIYKTRNQCMITDYLVKYIDKINDLDKLNYIKYECFDEYKKLTKSELIHHIGNEWNDKLMTGIEYILNNKL